MKEDINFHDKQIINIFCNPLKGSMQITIEYNLNVLLNININKIFKIKQSNLNCLFLIYQSGGGLDGGYIEKKEKKSTLNLSGIIDDFSNTNFENNWSFEIEAEEISYQFIKSTEDLIDKLEDKNFIDFL